MDELATLSIGAISILMKIFTRPRLVLLRRPIFTPNFDFPMGKNTLP